MVEDFKNKNMHYGCTKTNRKNGTNVLVLTTGEGSMLKYRRNIVVKENKNGKG